MNNIRVLVAIANYGTGNRAYLDRLLSEYASMQCEVDVVVLSNVPKDLGPGVQVAVGLPSENPWSLPFAHRPLFAERVEDYDLFIYSEDDTLVRENNIRAFMEVTPDLHASEIAGFMRTEADGEGHTFYSTVHSCFRWDASSVRVRGREHYAYFTNEHAACYMVTQSQLRKALDSKGFLVEPHEGRYDMLCSAATDPYTRCGFTKLICISRMEDFSLQHLPNRYLGKMGLSHEDMTMQISALKALEGADTWTGPLYEVTSRLPHQKWSRNCYANAHPELISLVPGGDGPVLSFGCGLGNAEGALVNQGRRVVGIPVDPILGRCAESRGVEVVQGHPEAVEHVLGGTAFACLLLRDVLHLVPDPAQLLLDCSSRLAQEGVIVGSVPNMATWDIVWAKMMRKQGFENIDEYEHSGVRYTTKQRVKKWLERSGFQVDKVISTMTPKRRRYAKILGGLGESLLAGKYYFRAVRCSGGQMGSES